MEDFLSIDLVDEDIADGLFAQDDDPCLREMQLDLWQGARRDLLKDLKKVRAEFVAGNPQEARRMAHKVAGYAGSGALKRVAAALQKLDRGEIPDEQILVTLDDIAAWSAAGMDETARPWNSQGAEGTAPGRRPVDSVPGAFPCVSAPGGGGIASAFRGPSCPDRCRRGAFFRNDF